MSIIQENYNKIIVTSKKQLKDLFEADKPTIASFDTETDGVFSMTAQPFWVVFGWKNETDITIKGKVVGFSGSNIELIKTMYELCKDLPIVLAHNAKFDLHMLENRYKRYPHTNIYDTMVISRLVLESKPIKEGGPSLALKNLANKYIEKDSSNEQKIIKSIKTQIQNKRRKDFESKVFTIGEDPKKYSTAKLEKIEKDPILEVSERVPQSISTLWKEYKTNYPATKGMKVTERVTYKDIFNYSPQAKQAMINYAFNDVIYTLEIGIKFLPYITHVGQSKTLERERKAMYALYNSERIGIKINEDYVNKSKIKMKKYIVEKRKQLQVLLGDNIDAAMFPSSPTQIKAWLHNNKTPAETTNKEALIELSNSNIDSNTKTVLKLVLEIRKLIKKYSTDLLQYQVNAHNGRRYTTFSQAATVTGRLSNDMQQMPNEGIQDDEGNLLFDPRAAVVPSGNGYSRIAYLDYSQVEVRLQAHYTWIAMAGKGDTNMLRVYVPFNCVNEKGEPWDPKNNTHTKQPYIDSHQWKQIEDNKPWKITDMHLLTALKAYPQLQKLDPKSNEVQKFRKKAKPVNFGIQYGAGLNKIIKEVGSKEDGTALYNGNREAFPGLPAYALWLKKQYNKNGYVENAYGRKYKFNRYTHKMNNYVIQGSGADLLKEKAVECYEYLKDKKSRMIHNIHDELQFEIHDDETYVINELKAIMEKTGNMYIVPIVTDIETTKTNWAEKQEGII